MRAVTDKLLEWHASKEIGSALIVYTNFISTFEQQAVARQIIPITPVVIAEIIAGIRPARGRYAPQVKPAEGKVSRIRSSRALMQSLPCSCRAS